MVHQAKVEERYCNTAAESALRTHIGSVWESAIVTLQARGRLKPFTDVKGAVRNPVTAWQSAIGEVACRSDPSVQVKQPRYR